MKLCIRDVPPDQRPALLTLLPTDCSGTPLHLALHDRTTSADVPVPENADMDEWLSQRLCEQATMDSRVQDVLTSVVCMATWDSLFRSEGIYGGNVYIAGDDSVEKIIELAGAELSATANATTPGGILDILQALELIYRFPVAFKFVGLYTGRNQLRVNGWGRRLSIAAEQLVSNADEIQDRLARHISARAGDYSHALGHLETVARSGQPGTGAMDRSDKLPIPVLV